MEEVILPITDTIPPPTSGMPPVADLRGDRFVALETMDDSTGTSIARARFNGSYSYDPDDGLDRGEGITNYSWNFPGGDPNHVEGETKSTVSTEYTTVGEKTVTLTVTDNDDPAETNTTTGTVTVLKLSLEKPATITRADKVTFRAIIEPSGLNLNPTFSWKYTVGEWSTTVNTNTSNTWTGRMVVDGTLEFTATIGNDSLVHSEKITITPRSWVDDVLRLPTPEETNNNPLPVPPQQYEDLGVTVSDFPQLPETINVGIVQADANLGERPGPNEEWLFVRVKPITGRWSHKAYVNPDLYNTNSVFYDVNEQNRPPGYMVKLLENVLIHEGIIQEGDFESHAGKTLEYLKHYLLNPWAEAELVHKGDEDLQVVAQKFGQDVFDELKDRWITAQEEGGFLKTKRRPILWHPANKYPINVPNNPNSIPPPIFPRP